jgi:D-threonine aldolase
LGTVISSSPKGWVVADVGLKALGMDHGNPTWSEGQVLFCSDEHVTLVPADDASVRLGDRVRLIPGHVDPTIARHRQLWVVDGEQVVDRWPVDLRHW